MKNLIYAAFVLLIIFGCNSGKNLNQTTSKTTAVSDTVRIANDSLEYEITIIDPGFSTWLATRAYPREYHSLQYLESKNSLWVSEYNIRVNQPRRYGNLYTMQIAYNPSIRYGFEVNYLLYNYLVYFQNVNRQRLGGNVPER